MAVADLLSKFITHPRCFSPAPFLLVLTHVSPPCKPTSHTPSIFLDHELNCFLSDFFLVCILFFWFGSMSAVHVSPGVTEWTSWFNIDHPGGNGDYERLEAIRFYYRERVCARPMAMESRTTDWVAAADTGEVVHSSLEKGFWCINKEQPQGRICSNYHVRFQCPPGSWDYSSSGLHNMSPYTH